MEWPAQSPTSTPLKTCELTLKMQFLKQNPKTHRNCVLYFVHPGLKYGFIGTRSWLTRCNTDAQQSSKTMAMQLHFSSVI